MARRTRRGTPARSRRELRWCRISRSCSRTTPQKPRTEDDFIAYTWDKFLRTGDEKWPARLPMTKSAVRAMDAITAVRGGPEAAAPEVAGSWSRARPSAAGRRGRRRPSIAGRSPSCRRHRLLQRRAVVRHHYRAYGAWSDAVKDYTEQGIMDWMGTPQFRALMKIEEPYEYRDRLTMPKLMLNASGDQFFLPDSSQFYFDDLKGRRYLRYVPNTSHALDKSDALETAARVLCLRGHRHRAPADQVDL
jgi:hypothetical protein